MLWQDIVLAVGGYVLAIALVPTILGKNNKPALSSSLLTGGILVVYAYVYATLHFWNAMASVSIAAIAWFVLAAQKYFKR